MKETIYMKETYEETYERDLWKRYLKKTYERHMNRNESYLLKGLFLEVSFHGSYFKYVVLRSCW